VEGAGFDFLDATDHVAGAHPDRFIGIDVGFTSPPYYYDDPFHEPFTLFSYLSGLTTRLEFATSILVLPQRETVLVAKQAAEVQVLSEGRLRLGVGVGWNFAEFESLNSDFDTRGRRLEEQIQLLRRLWTEPLLSFEGNWHRLDRVGIAPLPPKPIPVWIGSRAFDSLLRRVARLADGWMPLPITGDAASTLSTLREYIRQEGRDPESFGLQMGVSVAGGSAGEWLEEARKRLALGVTHLAINTGQTDGSPWQSLERAIEAIRVLRQGIDL
jgi:probable F420-dependent oxidoreductase